MGIIILVLLFQIHLIAIQSGAVIIDGTLRGFGAGAGNCQLEVLAGLFIKIKN